MLSDHLYRAIPNAKTEKKAIQTNPNNFSLLLSVNDFKKFSRQFSNIYGADQKVIVT